MFINSISNYSKIDSMIFDPNNKNNIRLYHGTTHIGGLLIPTEGFEYTGISIWNCSDDDMAYFYELNRFCKSECLENEEFSYQQARILERANESAQIQEAMLKIPMYHTYVLEFVLPSEAKEFIEEDCSCENMVDYGAVQMYRDIINYFITQNKCAIHVYSFNFSPKCSFLYITSLLDNPYFIANFTEYELQIAEAIRDAGIYVEEISYCFDKYEQSYGPTEFNVYTGE